MMKTPSAMRYRSSYENGEHVIASKWYPDVPQETLGHIVMYG
jgi:hypothetical protein